MSQGGTLSGGGGSGDVTSVTGTANQISVSPTTGSVVVSFTDGISIGGYQPNTPPSGGIIMPGQFGIGVSVPGPQSLAHFNTPLAYGLNITGVVTQLDGANDQFGIVVTQVYSAPNGAANSFGINSSPSFVAPLGQTIQFAAGMQILSDFSTNVGQVDNAYGLYVPTGATATGSVALGYGGFFQQPAYGATRMALYSDNMSIGDSTVAPPTTGLYVLGDIQNAVLTASSVVATNSSKNLVSIDDGTAGQVLTSNGAATIPSFQSLPGLTLIILKTVFLTPGSFTYTPDPNVVYAFVQVLGGGGGGGGATNSGSVDVIAAGGGGGAGYTEAFIGASFLFPTVAVVVGAGGIGVSTNDGTDGTGSSFGATILVGNPGLGANLGEAESGFNAGGSGGGFAGSAAVYGYSGQNGGASGPPSGVASGDIPPYAYSGYGGSCFTGRQGEGYGWSTLIGPIAADGEDQTEYGCGGPGGFSAIGSGPSAGGDGAGGFVLITEYILS